MRLLGQQEGGAREAQGGREKQGLPGGRKAGPLDVGQRVLEGLRRWEHLDDLDLGQGYTKSWAASGFREGLAAILYDRMVQNASSQHQIAVGIRLGRA